MKTGFLAVLCKMRFIGIVAMVLAIMTVTSTINGDQLPDEDVEGAGPALDKDKKKKRLKLVNGNPVDQDGDGKLDREDANVPDGATKVKAKTSDKIGTHQGGEVSPVVINTTESNATDLHFFVMESTGQKALRIGSVDIQKSNHPDAEDVGAPTPGNGAETGIQVPIGEDGTVADKLNDDKDNKDKATVEINLIIQIWNEDTRTWERYYNKDIEIYMWWTHGTDRDKPITVCMPDKLGSGDERIAIVDVHSDANLETLSLALESDTTVEYALNDIALGETDGHRFKSGSVVIAPTGGASFAEDISSVIIIAKNEDGMDVTSSEVFSLTDKRVDSDGNFVFEIERDEEDSSHICFVISGLKIANLPKLETVGQTINATVSGAVISDRLFNDVWELVKVTE